MPRASRLAALKPSVADLKASMAAIEIISPRRGRTSRRSQWSSALADAVGAACFLETAILRIHRLIAEAGKKARRMERSAIADAMTFLANAANFVQAVVTARIAGAGEAKRRG